MRDDIDINPRPAGTAIEPYATGGYTVFGHLQRPGKAPSLLALAQSSPENMQILRPFSPDLKLLDFHDRINLSRKFGKYTKQTAIEIDSSTFIKSQAFVSEPLSLILQRCLEHSSPLPLSLSVSICKGILRALSEAGMGQIHGALTPDRVLVGFDGSVAVVDPAGNKFGHEISSDSRYAGYRSPEHISRSELTAASDIFVIGIYLYEMTTGGQAFLGDTQEIETQITAARYRRPRSVVGRAYPIELQVVLRKLLNSNLEMRFDSLDVALDGLNLVTSEKQKQQRKIIQSYMHKTYSDRYEAWTEIFSQANINLPRLEVTEPAIQSGSLRSSTDSEQFSEDISNDFASASAETALGELMMPREVTQTDGQNSKEQATISAFTPLEDKDSRKPTPSRTLPPLSSPPRGETVPAVDPAAMRPTAPLPSKLEGDENSSVRPPLPAEPEAEGENFSQSLGTDIPSEYSPTPEQVPTFSNDTDEPTNSINEGQILSENRTHDEVSLVDTSDLSLEDDFPLSETDLAHLKLAADLLEKTSESTDRHHLSTSTPEPFAKTDEVQEDIPRLDLQGVSQTKPEMSQTEPRGELTIPQPRKLMERGDSDWAQTPDNKVQIPDAVTFDSPSTTTSESEFSPNEPKTDAEDPFASRDVNSSSNSFPNKKIQSEQPIPQQPPLSPAEYQHAEAFSEDSLLSEALVLPVSDTSLDREYLRQKKLIRIALIGVVLLSIIVVLLLRQLLLERTDSGNPKISTQQLKVTTTPKNDTKSKVPEINKTPADTLEKPTPEVTAVTQSSSSAQQIEQKPIKAIPTTTVSVMAFPLKKAKLFLDGEPVENGSKIAIKDKERVLVIKAKGYVTFEETLKPGRTSDVQVLLNRKKRRRR